MNWWPPSPPLAHSTNATIFFQLTAPSENKYKICNIVPFGQSCERAPQLPLSLSGHTQWQPPPLPSHWSPSQEHQVGLGFDLFKILQLCTQPATYTQIQSLTVFRKIPIKPTNTSITYPYPPISNSCLLHAPSPLNCQAEGPPGGGGGFNGHREYFSTCICQWLLTSHSFSWMSRHVNKINCRWTNINPAHPSPNPSGCSCYHTDFPLTSAAHDFFWKTCLP